MARIGDFREAYLSPDLISAHGAHDNVTFIRCVDSSSVDSKDSGLILTPSCLSVRRW